MNMKKNDKIARILKYTKLTNEIIAFMLLALSLVIKWR